MTFQHAPVPVAQAQPHLLAARQADFEAVAPLFGELHQHNASLDARFTLAENWRQLLEEQFRRTCSLSSALWLLPSCGTEAERRRDTSPHDAQIRWSVQREQKNRTGTRRLTHPTQGASWCV